MNKSKSAVVTDGGTKAVTGARTVENMAKAAGQAVADTTRAPRPGNVPAKETVGEKRARLEKAEAKKSEPKATKRK